MKLFGMVLVCVAALVLAGCASQSSFHKVTKNTQLVPADGKIEFAVDEDGEVTEVEYHIAKDSVPPKVLAAADKLYPDSTVTDAEKEFDGGVLYYEVTMKKGRDEFEVMLTPDGEPYRMEVSVNSSDAPEEMLRAADAAVPGGTRTSVEKILDGDKKLLEWHIKKTVNGIKYKILVSTEGEVIALFREVDAEIEVPLSLKKK